MKNLLQPVNLQKPNPNSCPKPILLPDPSFQLVKVEPGASFNFAQMTNIKPEIIFRPRTAKDIYSELYDYFGDMLSSKLPILELQHIYRAKKPEKLVKLYETNLSGEHLWHSMQQRFVAEIRKEHEEQERLEEERRERERLEHEQRERERLEREQQQKKAQAESMAKQEKRYHRQHPEKFWQPVPTEDEVEDSDNANEGDNRSSSDSSNSEEDTDDESDDDTDSVKETLAVARTVTNPDAGIKLVITKIPQKVHMHKSDKDSKGKSESSQRTERHKESKLSKKKKQSQRSNSNKYNSRMYCKEESSSNGRKLTIRLRCSENPPNPKTNSR